MSIAALLGRSNSALLKRGIHAFRDRVLLEYWKTVSLAEYNKPALRSALYCNLQFSLRAGYSVKLQGASFGETPVKGRGRRHEACFAMAPDRPAPGTRRHKRRLAVHVTDIPRIVLSRSVHCLVHTCL